MRVLVCGGRNYSDYYHVAGELDKLFPSDEDDLSTWLPPGDTVIIHGGANGADLMADDWATTRWVQTEVYKADWNTHGKAAGPIRNQQMIDEGKPDLVMAFPGGRGTADMVSRAHRANIEVRILVKGEAV